MVSTDVFLMAPIDQEPDNDCAFSQIFIKTHLTRRSDESSEKDCAGCHLLPSIAVYDGKVIAHGVS